MAVVSWCDYGSGVMNYVVTWAEAHGLCERRFATRPEAERYARTVRHGAPVITLAPPK